MMKSKDDTEKGDDGRENNGPDWVILTGDLKMIDDGKEYKEGNNASDMYVYVSVKEILY